MIEEKIAHIDITSKFNPPAAPHFTGAWERWDKYCKQAMFTIFEGRSLSGEILNNTMGLVEQTLNARPLTPVSDDPNDLEAVTPIHFLLN